MCAPTPWVTWCPRPTAQCAFFSVWHWHWVLRVRRPATWPCLENRLPEHWQQHPTMTLCAPALRCVLSGSRQWLLDPGAGDLVVFCMWASWSGPNAVLLIWFDALPIFTVPVFCLELLFHTIFFNHVDLFLVRNVLPHIEAFIVLSIQHNLIIK